MSRRRPILTDWPPKACGLPTTMRRRVARRARQLYHRRAANTHRAHHCWPKVLLAAKTYGSVFYDKLSPSIARGEVVGPVRDHVTMERWGDMSQVFIGNGRARLPESLDDSGNLERVPYQDRVGQESTIASDSDLPGTGLFRFRHYRAFRFGNGPCFAQY
jgi:hypothetical protein